MKLRRLAAVGAWALAATYTASAAPLPADGQWQTFDVDSLSALSGGLEWIDLADGSALQFAFTIPTGFVGTLTVVDGGFAGDRFELRNGASLLGVTGTAGASYPASIGLDFDAALADANYSRGQFTLAAGQYSLSGLLIASATVDGQALDATVGGVRLQISAVPEPASMALLAAGLLLTAVLRRQDRSR